MRTRIKVCCIASLDEARAAIDAGADALGLVARMPSGPGPIADDAIAAIAAAVPPPVASFMLTAESTAAAIAAHAGRTRPTVVQVVSHIDPAESARLAALLSAARIVQVIHVENEDALERISCYVPHVHAFLLDSGRPSAPIPELGGTGRVHDWSISARFVEQATMRAGKPVFLAGGLRPDNVGEALRAVRPFGVDVCSGVRTGGTLDLSKLRAFVAAVRSADAERP